MNLTNLLDLQLLTVSSSDMTRAQEADVIDLCSRVFNLDYSYYTSLCPVRVHVLGYADDRLVSHALWLDRRLRIGDGPWLNTAYVEGVATHPDYRKLGYGSAVMQRVQQEISGYDLGALSPAREDWYARLGWQRWLGALWIDKQGSLIPTLDEAVMVYRTPRTGDLDLAATLTGEWRPFEPW